MTIKFSCRVRMKFGASKMNSKKFRNQDQNSLWMLAIKRMSNILWPSSGRPNRNEWQLNYACVTLYGNGPSIQIQTNATKSNEGQTMDGNKQQKLCDNTVTVSHVNVSKSRNSVHGTKKGHPFRHLTILPASTPISCVIIY